MLKVLLLFLLLQSVSSDRLRYHLENLVDRNVSACEDFFHHVCSQHVDPDEFYNRQIPSIFADLFDRLQSETLKNSPIQYDFELTKRFQYKHEDNDYANLSRLRCKDDLACYIDDRQYYARFLRKLNGKEENEEPHNFSVNPAGSSEVTIINHIVNTSAMIDELITFMNDKRKLDYLYIMYDSMKINTALLTRIQMMEFMATNSTFTDFHDIEAIVEKMKNLMIDNMEKTPWLQRDEFQILAEIKAKLANIQIYYDFDEIDKNITNMQKINRDWNELYFKTKRFLITLSNHDTFRNTGVRGMDILFGLHDAFDALVQTLSQEMSMALYRIGQQFKHSGGYANAYNSMIISAPFFYRPTFHSEILKEPFELYFTIGHELYHALFNKDSSPPLELYGHRRDCVVRHYQKACSKFTKRKCFSGGQTITEDAPDLESARMSYTLLHNTYSAEELNKRINGLETTLEQAFFYYNSLTFCSNDKNSYTPHHDEHSADNIRVNAVLSLMPEFTKAFGCRKGDAMYVEQKDSCYVFGPNS